MKTPYLDTEINLIEGYKENKVASFYQIRKLVEYREIKQLLLHVVGKSLKVDIQHFDLTDCPYQINTFLEKYKIEKDQIISFSRSDKYLTMVYETF